MEVALQTILKKSKRVTRILSGERKSIVSWISGQPFK